MAEMSAGIGNVLPIATSILGSVMGAEGNRQAGQAAYDSGAAQKVAYDYQAAQERVNAGQAIAASQRENMEKLRQAKLVQSRLLAVAGASGGGVSSDPTIVHLSAMIAGEGALRGATALYQGQETARQLLTQANADEYSGRVAEAGGANAQAAYETRANANLLTTAGSLFAKYGMGGPDKLSDGVGTKSGDTMTGGFGDLPTLMPNLEMTMVG